MQKVATSIQGDITKTLYVDDEGNAVIQKTQDHTEWMERNRAIRDTATGTESFRHIGFIPDCVIDQWKKEGIDIYNKEDLPKVIAKLSSSEFHLLKTGDI